MAATARFGDVAVSRRSTFIGKPNFVGITQSKAETFAILKFYSVGFDFDPITVIGISFRIAVPNLSLNQFVTSIFQPYSRTRRHI